MEVEGDSGEVSRDTTGGYATFVDEIVGLQLKLMNRM
jgi:hypothetical protein